MNPNRSSSNHGGRDKSKEFDAAWRYIRKYPQQVATLLVNHHDVFELLQDACSSNRDDYHEVMSKNYDREDDVRSHSSQRMTSPRQSQSALLSSSSVVPSSSGTDVDDSPPDFIWAEAGNGLEPLTLQTRTYNDSDHLITLEACRRLHVKHQSINKIVRYRGGNMKSVGSLSLHWAKRAQDMKAKRTQRFKFYVVDELYEGDIVLGDSTGVDQSVARDDLSYAHHVQPRSPSQRLHAGELPLHDVLYGMQEHPPTRLHIPDSTNVPAKRTSSLRSGSNSKVLRYNALPETKIPKARISTNKSKSASIESPSSPAARSTLGDHPLPSSSAKPALVPWYYVTVIYGGLETGLKLELDVSGGIFYEALQHVIKRKGHAELKRDFDQVYFSADRENLAVSSVVSLLEDEVNNDWEIASEWLAKHRPTPPDRIYAIIKSYTG